ncbi:MAG: hypothetical protein GF416_02415 [Candidatus Altiarchaeales archaeon]|nr:hypothetical protein [Candidatus Altiarchaeales archaeon]MBD3415973.1 hypothetical protein [Candidatus Altiarchaeales archaeon]
MGQAESERGRFYSVKQPPQHGEADLIELRTASLPKPISQTPEGVMRPSNILLMVPDESGGSRLFLVREYIKREGVDFLPGKGKSPKLRVGSGEAPRFVAVRDNKAFVIEFEEYGMVEDVPPTTGLEKGQIGDLIELRDHLVPMIRHMKEAVSHAEAQGSGYIPFYPYDPEGIEAVLTPAPVDKMAEKAMGLDVMSASYIRREANGYGVKIPGPLHDSLLKRMGEGRLTDIEDRRVAGALMPWAFEFICPLDASTMSHHDAAGPLWACAGFAQARVEAGDRGGAAEYISSGLKNAITVLERRPWVQYVGRSSGLVEKNRRNRNSNYRHELELLGENADSVAGLLARGQMCRQTALEGGPGLYTAFDRWLPVFLIGMNNHLNDSGLRRSASNREHQIRMIAESGGEDQMTEQSAEMLRSAIAGYAKAAGSAVRCNAGDLELQVQSADGLLNSALTWSSTLEHATQPSTGLWVSPQEDFLQMTDPQNIRRVVEALNHLV